MNQVSSSLRFGILLVCVCAAALGCAGGGGVQVTAETKAPAVVPMVVIEAEDGQLTEPMAVVVDPAASGGKFIASGGWEAGQAAYTFELPSAGEYVVWTRVLGPDAASDSFFVAANDGKEDIFDAAEQTWGVWHWRTVNGRGVTEELMYYNPRVFKLRQGVNTIVFKGREPDCGLDKLIITSDRDFEPAKD